MSADVTRTWAGSPSRIAVSEGPWDSPAVSQRSMAPVFHAPIRPRDAPSVPETSGELSSDQHRQQGPDQHEGAVREPSSHVTVRDREHHATDAADEDHQ